MDVAGSIGKVWSCSACSMAGAKSPVEESSDLAVTTYLEVRRAITLSLCTAGTSTRPTNPNGNLFTAHLGPP